MLVALISSSGVRIVNVPDPMPREVSLPDTRIKRTREGSRPVYRTRRFVKQDEHTYVEAEEIGSVR